MTRIIDEGKLKMVREEDDIYVCRSDLLIMFARLIIISESDEVKNTLNDMIKILKNPTV